MNPKMVSLKEAAEMVGRSESTIRNWIRGTYTKNGKTQICKVKFVPAYKYGSQYSFREVDINRWLEAHKCSNSSIC